MQTKKEIISILENEIVHEMVILADSLQKLQLNDLAVKQNALRYKVIDRLEKLKEECDGS